MTSSSTNQNFSITVEFSKGLLQNPLIFWHKKADRKRNNSGGKQSGAFLEAQIFPLGADGNLNGAQRGIHEGLILNEC